MKRVSLIFFTFLFLNSIATSQSIPGLFNYSAVARDSSGLPIPSTAIGIQISILKSTQNGTPVYSENHTVNTDAFGLFHLTIGAGTSQSGNISSIEWYNDRYYLKVGMAVGGGSNYIEMGTKQFLSVPYALYAQTAGQVAGSAGGFTHYIGEQYGGGVVFYLWKDEQGQEHGLIVDIIELSTAHVWSNLEQTLIGSSAQSRWDGWSNSIAIVNQAGHTTSAAQLCIGSSNQGQTDWYLPSADEISLLWHNRFNVNKTLSTINGADLMSKFDLYWTSSETDNHVAIAIDFQSGQLSTGSLKSQAMHVRAIRAF